MSMDLLSEDKNTKCACDICVKWIPFFKRVKPRISKADGLLLDELRNDSWALTGDLEMAKAKLAGEWPGWAWIKEEKKKRGIK